MSASAARDPEQLRADARANRDAILDAAAALYAERPPAIPAGEIAKAAGVGRATLSRRFPTPESLRIAVLEQLVEGLEHIAGHLPDGPSALAIFIERALALLAANAPLVDLMRAPADPPTGAGPLLARVREAVEAPLQLAHDAGLVPRDIEPEDIRIVLFMASSAERGTAKADRSRVARLTWRALGMAHPTTMSGRTHGPAR